MGRHRWFAVCERTSDQQTKDEFAICLNQLQVLIYYQPRLWLSQHNAISLLLNDLNPDVVDKVLQYRNDESINLNLLDLFDIQNPSCEMIKLCTYFKWNPRKFSQQHARHKSSINTYHHAYRNAQSIFNEGYDLGFQFERIVNTLLNGQPQLKNHLKLNLVKEYINGWQREFCESTKQAVKNKPNFLKVTSEKYNDLIAYALEQETQVHYGLMEDLIEKFSDEKQKWQTKFSQHNELFTQEIRMKIRQLLGVAVHQNLDGMKAAFLIKNGNEERWFFKD